MTFLPFHFPFARRAITATIVLSLPCWLGAAKPSAGNLGDVQFANSGTSEVQENFLRGLAALHSFWYEEAAERFRATTAIDPTFALGYWGEALSYNHSLWGRQDLDFARRTLAKIKDTSHLTPREQAYIAAARVLYGEGDKLTRDRAYAQALEKIQADYPDDLDAAAFHALAILGTVRPGELGYERQLRAAAIAEEVTRRNPLHPGATHYTIHAYDHPDYANRGLAAARHYAKIAPEAFHAQHMPSHIFVQLGMWDESARSNEIAWRVSDEWVKAKQYDFGLRDYHSYHWLVYTRLQQGRYHEAGKLLRDLRTVIAERGWESVNFYDQIAAIYVIETRDWTGADEWLQRPAGANTVPARQVPVEFCGDRSTLRRDTQRNNTELPIVIRAFAATAGDREGAGQLRDAARAATVADDNYEQTLHQIRLLQIEGLKAAGRNDFDAAEKSLEKASALEAATAKPSGPPRLIKPSHELFGELLLQASKPAEAVKQFRIALVRQPGRAHALLGLARAQAQAGDPLAARASYVKLLESWHNADADRPEVSEAKQYLATTPAITAVR